MIRKYRKKPVVIEALQWLGDNHDDFRGWVPNLEYSGDYLYIHTREGRMQADPKDWVIKGVQGEFYPCKPDIFAATYDKVHG